MPAHSSGSNWLVEASMKQVRSQCRALRLSLEPRDEVRIDSEHIARPWLVRHGAWTLNGYKAPTEGAHSTSLKR